MNLEETYINDSKLVQKIQYLSSPKKKEKKWVVINKRKTLLVLSGWTIEITARRVWYMGISLISTREVSPKIVRAESKMTAIREGIKHLYQYRRILILSQSIWDICYISRAGA
jgi:hypothetical protein